jgi:glycosyltransferase involved in cell wall biosynthesis
MGKHPVVNFLDKTMVPRQKDHFRVHIVGLSHLPVNNSYAGCAFTSKHYKMAKMLMDLGHEVFVYGAEGGNCPCTEYVVTHSLQDIREAWGDGDNRFEIGYNWREGMFRHDINKTPTECTKKFITNSIAEINKRKQPDDFLMIMQGWFNKPIADAIDLFLTMEPGIGYRGSVPRLNSGKTVYRGFESSYIQNFTYGRENAVSGDTPNGAYYDRIFPNYFDKKDFKYKAKKQDYFFFIGRLIHRKGVQTAIETARALSKKIIIAGQRDDNEKIDMSYEGVEYVGYVDPDKRTELMANAKACFIPTWYLEPFGGTNVESQLCGTPVLTTDFGAFTDTVIQGVTGFRCHTLNDFVQCAKLVDTLDPKKIRAHAERYLMDNMMWELEDWMRELYQVYLSATVPNTKGWSLIMV